MTPEELQGMILGLDSELSLREASSVLMIKVPTSSLMKIMASLKEDPRFAFDQLQYHTALDWPAEDRIECLYHFCSTQFHHELMISVSLPRTNPVLPSVSHLWPIAEWQEREVYDMFGVIYENHPDLRRILLDDDWKGFPLRKDYKDEFMLERPW